MVAYVVMEPGASAVPDHHQPFEDELWFAVQGEWEWKVGTETRRVGPGAFAYAPRGQRMRSPMSGDSTAIMLTVNAPAGHEPRLPRCQRAHERRGTCRGDPAALREPRLRLPRVDASVTVRVG